MRSEEDFGFSLVDDDFVPPKAEVIMKQVKDDATQSAQRLTDVMDMIIPLVENLSKDPSKTTIYWPNRVEKMTEFKKKLYAVAGMDPPNV